MMRRGAPTPFLIESSRFRLSTPRGPRCAGPREDNNDGFLATTANALSGYRVKRELSVVRGIIVRSRSIVGNIGASSRRCSGVTSRSTRSSANRARADAYALMLQHAAERGGNAVLAVRFDATEVMAGVTEVLCYGTAVVVEAETSQPAT